ncbi:MAG: sugar phosphate isomerase/epimerase [Candidatus Bathyarchaeota archaeon]|nr:sugar phosphate isomerase/epimerase [Candidatus Bathyarchaeota archaeon]
MRIILFSKMFQSMPMERFADLAVDMGFEGIDLTVRPGGYIEPSDASWKLPEALKIFESRGLSIPMITTSIVSSDEPYAKEIFSKTSELGIRYIKLGYWRYRGFRYLKRQIEEVRESLKGIEKLCREYNVTAGLHTHSGMYMTAEPAILGSILEGFDPEYIGAYIDPGHMTVEGGLAGWLMGMDILSDRIVMVAVKDFGWIKTERGWVAHTVPLGEGLVPWKKVFEILKEIGFKGPISLHSEYHEDLDKIIDITREDIAYIKGIASGL